MAINPAMNNPYFTAILAVPQAWLAFFLFGKLQDQIALAVILASFFGLAALLTLILAAIRIPAWHRSRRTAKVWAAEHNGEVPPELKWYS